MKDAPKTNPKTAGDCSSTASDLPSRRHLQRLDSIFPSIKSVVFFVTVCTHHREPVLAAPAVTEVLVGALKDSLVDHGWMVGRYVVMPDHVHFFASPCGDNAKRLSSFVGFWKRSTATTIRKRTLPSFAWQREFFDHLLRNDESYARKWEYVRLNPVRAGLVADAQEWPYQGEIRVF